jgi:hypothetical protein
MAILGIRMGADKDPEPFDALERAGFKCERYGDLHHFLLERLGGHYLDIGCSAKIAQGLVGSICIQVSPLSID